MGIKVPVEVTGQPGEASARYSYQPVCQNCQSLEIKNKQIQASLTEDALRQLLGKSSKFRCTLCDSKSTLYLKEEGGEYYFEIEMDEAAGMDKFLPLEYDNGLDFRTGKIYDPPIIKCQRCTADIPYKVEASQKIVDELGMFKIKCPKCAVGYQIYGYKEKTIFTKIFFPTYMQLVAALKSEGWEEESIKESFHKEWFLL